MSNCQICGEPMPAGEQMFKFHGLSGPCPKPPLPKPTPEDRAKTAYDTFRGGFDASACPAPEWDGAPPWVRDVVKVAYLQGKLDRS
jgi:hypothetical protein